MKHLIKKLLLWFVSKHLWKTKGKAKYFKPKKKKSLKYKLTKKLFG